MSQTERFYKLRHLLGNGRCVSAASLLHEFGISQVMLKRDLAHLRDRMNTPVVCASPMRSSLVMNRSFVQALVSARRPSRALGLIEKHPQTHSTAR